ncbi:MAG TPA: gliding motility-associated C-terminal domain-containing protein, partial [Bacteroidia bacterium]
FNSSFIVPNVFTPNKDGFNDCFELEGNGASDCLKKEVLIFDRWGILVFQGINPETCWNGRFYNKGEELSDGVYYYLIYDLNDTAVDPVCGTVQLIR